MNFVSTKIYLNLPIQLNVVAKNIVLLIGGPGSGKTTLIDELVKRGHTCYPEISREVTKQAQDAGIAQLFLEKPLLFSELLLEGRIKQYHDAAGAGCDTVFIDRGIPDVLAYMHYIGDSYPASFDQACKEHVYTKIFYLPPWEEIYRADEERYENYDQAQLIASHLQETYEGYGYTLTEVPKDTVDNRILFILGHLS